ncbi:PucR family transcriptional regulator [Peribacillus kribbensis]|uniref:PucR family transcriptional regulator n=1 Tax=Peribacillus kribbensis TaxID=356658 RepID=UPI00040C0E9D|nr:helix-turn-helix domain-containing protein [Peribacillus kribbensis]
MLDKLKQTFQGSFIHSPEQPPSSDNLYIQTEGKILGIPKDIISEKEAALLTALFPLDPKPEQNFGSLSEKDQWRKFLTSPEGQEQLPLTSWTYVRFAFFSIQGGNPARREAEEAFWTLFQRTSIVLWNSNTEGVLIEPLSAEHLKKNEMEPVLSAIESDFFIRLKLFISSFYEIDNCLPEAYAFMNHCRAIGERYSPSHKLQTVSSVFPFLMSTGLDDASLSRLAEHLLGETLKDEELISTIKTYIECSSNASLAAKKLFMHRNSLQYRIDKFIEKTGLDIRTFEDALTVYLLIAVSLSRISR